jgi:hypothetical protein
MQRLTVGQIVLLTVLMLILILTTMWALYVWNASGDAPMDKHGWIALGLGSFFSLLIGCGLMALMFFSSRSGHDEVADPFRGRQPPAELGDPQTSTQKSIASNGSDRGRG